MNFKVCEKMDYNFDVDEKFDLFLTVRNNVGEIKDRVIVADPLVKGYIYACLFFYDEVKKETDKLNKMIKKIFEEVKLELSMEDSNPARFMLEVSARVRNAVGDDSLDALIKEILGETHRHMALLPDEGETEKFSKVKESIFLELFNKFYNSTICQAKDVGGKKSFKLAKEYVDQMTTRQRKLLAPALKMTGFVNQLKLNEFEMLPDFAVRYVPERIPQAFDNNEEAIKQTIKKFMEAHIFKD